MRELRRDGIEEEERNREIHDLRRRDAARVVELARLGGKPADPRREDEDEHVGDRDEAVRRTFLYVVL